MGRAGVKPAQTPICLPVLPPSLELRVQEPHTQRGNRLSVCLSSYRHSPNNPFVFGLNLLRVKKPVPVPLPGHAFHPPENVVIPQEPGEGIGQSIHWQPQAVRNPEMPLTPTEMHYLSLAKATKLSVYDMQHVLNGRCVKDLKPFIGRNKRARSQNISLTASTSRGASNPGEPDDDISDRPNKSMRLQDSALDESLPGHAIVHNTDAVDSGCESVVKVNQYASERGGGATRITLLEALDEPPERSTVLEAHNLESLGEVQFVSGCSVPDPDNTARSFTFAAPDPVHCACFNIGVGIDGSPLLSWSRIHSIYVLQDGSIWAEHDDYYDIEDMRAFAGKAKYVLADKMPSDLGPNELVRIRQQVHSRVQNIEYESWVYGSSIPSKLSAHVQSNSYKWRYSSDTAFNFIKHF